MKTAFLILIFLCGATNVLADTPPEAPANKIVCSANKRYCAFLDYERKQTTIYRMSRQRGSIKKQQRVELWKMPGWFRNAALANDGEHFVVGYDGANLLELDYRPTQTMLQFYRTGELLREIKLNQLIEDLTKLRRTVSHYAWCESYGFDERGKYAVTTVENRRFEFDPTIGEAAGVELLRSAATASQNDQDAQIRVRSRSEPDGKNENLSQKWNANFSSHC